MSTPAEERESPHAFPSLVERSSDEEGTVVGDSNTPARNHSSHARDLDDAPNFLAPLKTTQSRRTLDTSNLASPSQDREQAHRLDDDLHMLQVEREVSADLEKTSTKGGRSSNTRSRVRHEEPVDEFDAATNPLHERTQVYKPPSHPDTDIGKFFKKVHNSNWVVRAVTYITPVLLIILIPILLGFLLPAANGSQKNADGSNKQIASVGGVQLPWFFIWIMVVWLTLWAGRVSQ